MRRDHIALAKPAPAALPSPLPLLLPSMPNCWALLPYLQRIDAAKRYTNFGPLVRELESRLRLRFGAQTSYPLQAVTVSSATLGIELALAALGLPAGARVLVPALTFAASLTAIARAGLVPVVTDIDPHSWLLTPEIAEATVAAVGASAVLAVATFGAAQDSRAWSAFQRRTGVRVVIDAAGAFGSQWLDAPDIAAVFSMHATKSLPAGEGGFVVCGDAALAARIATMSNFGLPGTVPNEAAPSRAPAGATNAKLSEYHAAVALASLDTWDRNSAHRQHLQTRYRTLLDQACGDALSWQRTSAPPLSNIFCVRLGSDLGRRYLETLCERAAIETRRWYQPLLHRHASGRGPIVRLPVPNSERIATDLIGLPFSCAMSEADMAQVADTVRRALDLARYA